MTRSPAIGTRRLGAIRYLLFVAIVGQAALVSRVEAAPPAAGYRDFYFGTSPYATATGEKPESKLWWNDGSWWGCLWDPTNNHYSIHRFDVSSQSWTNTGTPIDPRSTTKADILWDGTSLYVVSHRFTLTPGPMPTSPGRLYRYSYDAGLQTYSLDVGFPVNVNASESECLVIDKDSSGKLWVAWVENGKVRINRSLGDDLIWGEPFDLPVQGTDVQVDDIASIVAIGGGRVGVMWSNQNDVTMYFAIHQSGNPDDQWDPREEALADPVLGAVADDHINLKMSCDLSGTLYAVTKTGLTSGQNPLVYVLRRLSSGVWSRHVVARVVDAYTRPILCLDPAAGVVYVFAQSNANPSGREIIYMKSASTTDLQFPVGVGTPVIDSSDDPLVNNPTASKQCVGPNTGILILASDQSTRFYLHSYLPLAGPPAIRFFTPVSGTVGTEVEVHGTDLVNVQSVRFNGVEADFTMDSDTLVQATVPSGATSGPITVTTSLGSATSAETFTLLSPIISFFTPKLGPVGELVEVHGAEFVNVRGVRFDGVTAIFIVESDTLLQTRVPPGAHTGVITVTTHLGSNSSDEVFTVTVPSAAALNLATPRALALHQSRPNPFAAAGTSISFDLPVAARAQLVVYDAHGRKIRLLEDGQFPPGTYSTRWDGCDGAGTPLPNGLYFLRLEVPGQIRNRKLLLMR